MPKGIYKRKPRPSSYPLKTRLHCSKCQYVWRYEGTNASSLCPICGKLVDTRDRTRDIKRYMELNLKQGKKPFDWKGHKKEYIKKSRLDMRRKLFAIISKSANPKCVNCGCDDIRLLEINHKNGGGNREYKRGKSSATFYWNIIMLRRDTEDLELLCRVCNAKHALEIKYGELPIVVMWKG